MLGNRANQPFDLRVADRRIHASELETLTAADPGLADDGNPEIKQPLPQCTIERILIDSWPRRNITEHDGGEAGSMDQLQFRSAARCLGSSMRQFDGALDHRTQLLPPQHLKRQPQFEHIESAGGEQRICYQVWNALLFVHFGIEIIRMQFNKLEVTSVPQHKDAGRDRLPEEFVKIEAHRVRGSNAFQLVPVAA